MLTLTLPPTEEPISLKLARAHLRAPELIDDEYISHLITVARLHFEDHDDRRLVTQKWKLQLDWFPAVIEIPLRPVQTIDQISYLDNDGVWQVLDYELYEADYDSFLTRITPVYGQTWPTTRTENGKPAVEIAFTVGYGNQDAVPKNLIQALLLHIGTMYENREDEQVQALNKIHRGYNALIHPNRRMKVS